MSIVTVYADGKTDAFTADGGADGVITIGDTSPYYAGAVVNLKATGLGAEAVITAIIDATHLKVRINNSKKFGASDVSAYTLVKGATISMPDQILDGHNESSLKFIGYWSGR